ncbi:uncharacterized protein LOC129724763 [Wyeomyia smithii]|uniref:uncharacterized protein LOC129724763 n=1 Tax=Wyeomyia smithii TaxID=174621 RepID=UPI002467F8EA|nr:uncharacterized protein LOC129724763 [Wyeomyia smithii]
MPEVMPTPTKEKWRKIANDFETQWNFPNCVAAIDGKHVTINKPANSGSKYFNYKKTYSVVLLALVDAHGNFIAVDVGSFGKESDGGIFASSNMGKRFQNGTFAMPEDAPLPGTNQSAPFVVVGDEAFPLKTYLMRPYPGQNLDDAKRIFNYRLSRARRVSENAFGMLAAWCRMYCRTIHANPENIDYLIFSSCVLHNHIRTFHGVTPAYSASSSEDQVSPCLSKLPAQGGNSSRNAFNARESFKNYFNSTEGLVPWQ